MKQTSFIYTYIQPFSKEVWVSTSLFLQILFMPVALLLHKLSHKLPSFSHGTMCEYFL